MYKLYYKQIIMEKINKENTAKEDNSTKKIIDKIKKKEIIQATIEKVKIKDFPIDTEERKSYIENNKKLLEEYRERQKKHSANWFAFDYMSKYPGQYILLKDIQEYCSNSYKEINGEILGDPPRSFEICRKNTLPLAWEEEKVSKYKLVRFNPSRVEKISDGTVVDVPVTITDQDITFDSNVDLTGHVIKVWYES